MAASLAVVACQSNQMAGSVSSGKPDRPSWCDITWPTVTSCLPACANSGQTEATVWS
jgi:hypothetical protein